MKARKDPPQKRLLWGKLKFVAVANLALTPPLGGCHIPVWPDGVAGIIPMFDCPAKAARFWNCDPAVLDKFEVNE